MKGQWIGFVAGFLLAAGISTVLIALKVIDVVTLGLSLPLTIAASVGIVAFGGVVAGMLVSGVQLLMNLKAGHMSKPSNLGSEHDYESAVQPEQHTQKDDFLNRRFMHQTRVVHDILSPSRVIDEGQIKLEQEMPDENYEIGTTVIMNVK